MAEVRKGVAVALITARGGSKGLPKKNILPLLGKPLIAWTIEAALAAASVDRVFVSTDCQEIADISVQYGAEVPCLRPEEFAQDTSPHIHAVTHAVRHFMDQQHLPEWVILLQPTSPLRTTADIDGGMNVAREAGAGSVISVREAGQHPFKMFCLDAEGGLELLTITNPNFQKTVEYPRRQDLPPAYQENGAFYIHRTEDLLSAGGADLPFRKHCLTGLCKPFVIPAGRSADVDTIEDLRLCEAAMRRMLASSAPPNCALDGWEARAGRPVVMPVVQDTAGMDRASRAGCEVVEVATGLSPEMLEELAGKALDLKMGVCYAIESAEQLPTLNNLCERGIRLWLKLQGLNHSWIDQVTVLKCPIAVVAPIAEQTQVLHMLQRIRAAHLPAVWLLDCSVGTTHLSDLQAVSNAVPDSILGLNSCEDLAVCLGAITLGALVVSISTTVGEGELSAMVRGTRAITVSLMRDLDASRRLG